MPATSLAPRLVPQLAQLGASSAVRRDRGADKVVGELTFQARGATLGLSKNSAPTSLTSGSSCLRALLASLNVIS